MAPVVFGVFIFCLVISGVKCQSRWCYLSDNPNWVWIKEDPSQAFAVECTESCLREESSIWGTEVYSYDSNICRAAVHDGRLSWWNSQSNRVVHIQRHPDVLSYLGSTRFGITSHSYGALRYKFGCFRFTSSRISEEILDVTLLMRPALHTNKEDVVFECHARTNALRYPSPYFGTQLTIPPSSASAASSSSSSSSLMKFAPVNRTNSAQRSCFEFVVPSGDEERRTGAYFCAFPEATLSWVLALSMRRDAYFLPSSVTRTVSVGDTSVTLSVDVQFAMGGQWTTQWYKDGQLVSTGPYLTFGQVQLGHTGLYSVLYKDATRLDRRALLRLIVRVCPENKFGSSCDRRCPVCLNGGICHDITGECICPPGFHGMACEMACETNRFGRNCSAWCSDKDSPDGCEGSMLCLPDPFGCSCAPGFTGLTCNSYCRSGSYGAGCSQVCGRCAKGSPCDRFSGVCSQGCEPGWKGPRCMITLPRLSTAPILLEATSESLSIGWSAWDPAIDPGDGHAVAYFVQYKERGKSEWKQDSFPGHVLHGTFNYTLGSLRPETDYEVRVLVLDQSGVVAKDSAPTANYSTVCESPLQSPHGITSDNSHPRQLIITWKVPASETWRCREVTFTVRYRANEEAHSSESGEWRRVTDLNDTRFILESRPFTRWTVQVRTENLAGASNWSAQVTDTSGQDAPSSVTHLQVTEVNPQSIQVSWNVPDVLNGLLSQYEVDVQLKELLACKDVDDGSTNLAAVRQTSSMRINTSDTLVKVSGLQAYAEYAVTVKAWTVVPGQAVGASVVTSQSVPPAAPVNLRSWYSYETELGFLWDSPSCAQVGGQLIAYLCLLEGIEPWVRDGEHRYIVEHKHGSVNGNISADGLIWIKQLKPFSTYSLRVHAGTSVGFSDTFATASSRTKPDVPPSPTNLTMYAKSWTSVSVVWSPPYPPHGEIESFGLLIDPCPLVSSPPLSPSLIPCNVTVDAHLTSCPHPTRRNQHCFTWLSLSPNQSYTLWVSAKNKEVKGLSDLSESLVVETVESSDSWSAFIYSVHQREPCHFAGQVGNTIIHRRNHFILSNQFFVR